MTSIPKKIWPLIDGAFPTHTSLIGTVLDNGFAQITPRGSTQVHDDRHISIWERGRGSTTAQMRDGSNVTVFYFNLGAKDVLPIGGLVRLYGRASVHKSGPVYDKVWGRLIEVDRVEDLLGQPLKAE